MNASEMMINGRAAKRVELGGAVLWEKGGKEYEELEWIVCNQHHVTGMPALPSYRYITRFRLTSNLSSDLKLLGNRMIGLAIYQSKWRMGYNNKFLISNIYVDNLQHVYTSQNDRGFSEIDEVEMTAEAHTIAGDEFWLWGMQGEPGNFAFELYSHDVYRIADNSLLQSLRPVMRISDSVYGLYDRVTESFVETAGFISAGQPTGTYYN